MTMLRRGFLLLLLVALAGCNRYYFKPGAETFCTTGNGSPNRPLICVNEQTLQTSPETAYVFDVEARGGKPTGRPVIIQWATQRGANLSITFNEPGCVDDVQCSGNGHCFAKVRRITDGRPRRCNYTVMVNDAVLDPPVVVTPCCMVTDDMTDQLSN